MLTCCKHAFSLLSQTVLSHRRASARALTVNDTHAHAHMQSVQHGQYLCGNARVDFCKAEEAPHGKGPRRHGCDAGDDLPPISIVWDGAKRHLSQCFGWRKRVLKRMHCRYRITPSQWAFSGRFCTHRAASWISEYKVAYVYTASSPAPAEQHRRVGSRC